MICIGSKVSVAIVVIYTEYLCISFPHYYSVTDKEFEHGLRGILDIIQLSVQNTIFYQRTNSSKL